MPMNLGVDGTCGLVAVTTGEAKLVRFLTAIASTSVAAANARLDT